MCPAKGLGSAGGAEGLPTVLLLLADLPGAPQMLPAVRGWAGDTGPTSGASSLSSTRAISGLTPFPGLGSGWKVLTSLHRQPLRLPSLGLPGVSGGSAPERRCLLEPAELCGWKRVLGKDPHRVTRPSQGDPIVTSLLGSGVWREGVMVGLTPRPWAS